MAVQRSSRIFFSIGKSRGRGRREGVTCNKAPQPDLEQVHCGYVACPWTVRLPVHSMDEEFLSKQLSADEDSLWWGRFVYFFKNQELSSSVWVSPKSLLFLSSPSPLISSSTVFLLHLLFFDTIRVHINSLIWEMLIQILYMVMYCFILQHICVFAAQENHYNKY